MVLLLEPDYPLSSLFAASSGKASETCVGKRLQSNIDRNLSRRCLERSVGRLLYPSSHIQTSVPQRHLQQPAAKSTVHAAKLTIPRSPDVAFIHDLVFRRFSINGIPIANKTMLSWFTQKMTSIDHLKTKQEIRVVIAGSGALGLELAKGIIASPNVGKIVGILPVSNLPRFQALREHDSEVAIFDFANANQLTLLQSDSINANSFIDELRELNPHLLLVGGWGEILKQPILQVEELCSINCHGSLLPKYRGACPYFAPVFNGDATTGLTFHLIDKGIDTGEILLQKEFEIEPDETAIGLAKRSASKFGEKIAPLLQRLKTGDISPKPQTGTASYVPEKKSEWGWIPWNSPVAIIDQRLRALDGFLPLATSIDRLVIGFKSGKVIKPNPIQIASNRVKGSADLGYLRFSHQVTGESMKNSSLGDSLPGRVIAESEEHLFVSTRSSKYLVALEKPMIVPTGQTPPNIRLGAQFLSLECESILKFA